MEYSTKDIYINKPTLKLNTWNTQQIHNNSFVLKPIPDNFGEVIKKEGGDIAYSGSIIPVKENGMFIIQHPQELADVITFLAGESPFDFGIDIGIGSGGTSKIIRDYVSVYHTVFIDILEHHALNDHYERIKPLINTNIITEIWMCHVKRPCIETIKKLNLHGNCFAFLDSGHEYYSTKIEIDHMYEYLPNGSLVILHDTMYVTDVKRAVAEIDPTKFIKLMETKHLYGITIYQVSK